MTRPASPTVPCAWCELPVLERYGMHRHCRGMISNRPQVRLGREVGAVAGRFIAERLTTQGRTT